MRKRGFRKLQTEAGRGGHASFSLFALAGDTRSDDKKQIAALASTTVLHMKRGMSKDRTRERERESEEERKEGE